MTINLVSWPELFYNVQLNQSDNCTVWTWPMQSSMNFPHNIMLVLTSNHFVCLVVGSKGLLPERHSFLCHLLPCVRSHQDRSSWWGRQTRASTASPCWSYCRYATGDIFILNPSGPTNWGKYSNSWGYSPLISPNESIHLKCCVSCEFCLYCPWSCCSVRNAIHIPWSLHYNTFGVWITEHVLFRCPCCLSGDACWCDQNTSAGGSPRGPNYIQRHDRLL